MSQWAEIRHLHLVEGVPKKALARRFGLDVKTVRRAIARETAPERRETPKRGRELDRCRDRVVGWLREDPRLTAKRIGRLLEPEAGVVPERTLREFVAEVRRELFRPEAFVHRTHAPGETMEADFGTTLALIRGRLTRLRYLVGALPHSNAYFARCYLMERLECLLDGLSESFRWFGGVPGRVVLDNTSLAVKEVLRGPDRVEQRAFEAFRGAFPFHADFCAPGKGWEKGSVETGVAYVRDLCLRPMARAGSLEEINARILEELDRDLDRRRLPDGRTVRLALVAEREHLRPLPAHVPPACRTEPRVADKFGHVRVDQVRYSVPIRLAHRPVIVRLFPERVEIAEGAAVVAVHVRSLTPGDTVLDPLHVLPLLEHKHRAVPEATALQRWDLPRVFHDLREALRLRTRRPDQEWVRVLRLLESHPAEEVEEAAAEALRRGSPHADAVRQILRSSTRVPSPPPVPLDRPELARLTVAPPVLAAYDRLAAEKEVRP